MNAPPPLAHEEMLTLLERARAGDRQAEARLAESNLALVRSIVKRYAGRGVEYDDLFQLGSVGLVKAIKNFDPSYNVRFSTYAVPLIAGEIKRFLRDDGIVKVSRSLRELALCAQRVRDELSAGGHEAGVVEIAAALSESPADVAAALDAFLPTVSLSEARFDEEGGASRVEYLTDGAPEDLFVDKLLIKELLGRLDAREKQIIILRYFRDKTQSEIARMIGVSQVQVSRLESRILAKLRRLAAGEADDPPKPA